MLWMWLLVIVASAVSVLVGRSSVPKPAPAPKPRFGLHEAEVAAPSLPGGKFTRDTATTARVVTAVVGMTYGVADDIAANRHDLDAREEYSSGEIDELRTAIAREEATIAAIVARRTTVNDLASAFEV